VPALLGPAGMALQQETVSLHDPVDALVVGKRLALLAGLADQKSVPPAVFETPD
jgi:hypothetical protein